MRPDALSPSKEIRKSVKTTTEKPRGKQTREKSNLMLPAGDEGPAGREPFRMELGKLPGGVSGSSTKEPARVPNLREAGLANQDSLQIG